MGQKNSKVNRIVSHSHASTAETSTVEEISSPAPPRHVTRLSELIDFHDLFEAESPTPNSPNSPNSSTSPTTPNSSTSPPNSSTSPNSSNSPNSANFPTSSGSPTSLSPLTTRRSKPVLVQSPSGNILSPHEFLQRPDRKLTMEERKQSIRMNTESQIQMVESSGGEDRRNQQKRARRSCFCFWGA